MLSWSLDTSVSLPCRLVCADVKMGRVVKREVCRGECGTVLRKVVVSRRLAKTVDLLLSTHLDIIPLVLLERALSPLAEYSIPTTATSQCFTKA